MFKGYFPVCLTGFLLDLILGDPNTPFHPVVLIGRLISALEALLYPFNEGGENTGKSGRTGNTATEEKTGLLLRGTILAVLTAGITSGAVFLILQIAGSINGIVFIIAQALFCWTAIAAKSLRSSALKVGEALDRGERKEAAKALSMIVGRDTDSLSDEDIIRAAVESVAESTCDGVIAPIFYLLIGGPVLGFAYKAVNTLDSMVGYRNERYEYFGRISARLDDIMNFLPSRITALLLMISSIFHKETGGKRAFQVFIRDRYKHESPNSGQSEAAMAGALGISLGGNASYGGFVKHRDIMGAGAERKPETGDIKRAADLMYISTVLALTIAAVLYFIL